MTPTPRSLAELKTHARTLRNVWRCTATIALACCCLYIADSQWVAGVLCAAIFAVCADAARDITRTLRRLAHR